MKSVLQCVAAITSLVFMRVSGWPSGKFRLWQIESSLDDGNVVDIRPKSRPNASIVVEQVLPDGTDVTVVWSWLKATGQAKLVTVYFPY